MQRQRVAKTKTVEAPRQRTSGTFLSPRLPTPIAAHPVVPLQRSLGNQAVQRLLDTRVVQAKLRVSQPNDSYEQEADYVANRVMSIPEPQMQRACACGGACSSCQAAQPGEEHERMQTKRVQASDTGQIAAPPIVNEVLRSPGRPLDTAARRFMEPRFGQDFSQVRVHTDAKATESARAVNARAFTVGRDVVFGTGQFAPGTTQGRRLLAHELAHFSQQNGPLDRNHLLRKPGRLDLEGEAGTIEAVGPDVRKAGSPLPYREAMEVTERSLYEEYVRNCSGVRRLNRLTRELPIPPHEKVRRLEDRISFIPHYFAYGRPETDPVLRAAWRCAVECIFGSGYALLSEESELARAQCELSEARWHLVALSRHGRIPGRRGTGVPWISDPRVCFNGDKMAFYISEIKAGRPCG